MSMRSLTQTKTTPKPSFTPVQTGLLQRKCACGNSASLTGKCTECENKRLSLQRRANNQAEPNEVPPILHEMLREPGQPLDHDTRTFMESRFGHDFSQVNAYSAKRHPVDSIQTRTTELPTDIETETIGTGYLATTSVGSGLQTLTGNGSGGGSGGTGTTACGVTGVFSDIPTGVTLAATLTGSKLGAAFNMIADFRPTAIPCSCSCGEYRQYVRGTFTANGVNVVHSLGGGRTLHPTTFQEDGDVAAGTVYGHRSVLGTKSKFSRPDQATGCRFEGADEPGISSTTSGTVLAMNLDFMGELIDVCNGATLAGADWSVAGSATVP